MHPPCSTTTSFLDICVQYMTKLSINNDFPFTNCELPTVSYVTLHSIYGQHFPGIFNEDTPDTYWYTLEGKMSQTIRVSSSFIIIITKSEVQLCVQHIWKLHIPNKTPINSRTPDTKPGFGPSHGVHQKNTYVPSSNSSVTSLNQHLPPLYRHKVTGAKLLTNKPTADTSILGYCGLSRLLALLCILDFHNDSLLALKICCK